MGSEDIRDIGVTQFCVRLNQKSVYIDAAGMGWDAIPTRREKKELAMFVISSKHLDCGETLSYECIASQCFSCY
jgi:hypothetical protein